MCNHLPPFRRPPVQYNQTCLGFTISGSDFSGNAVVNNTLEQNNVKVGKTWEDGNTFEPIL